MTPAGAPLQFAVSDTPGAGVLRVLDGGPGLAPEDYPLVFQRGALHARYRGHRPVGAGGVGLALVHGLVTRMGGAIRADPAPDGGACFTVALPASYGRPSTAGPAQGGGDDRQDGSGTGRPNNPSNASRSSSAALRLRQRCPQTTHRCTTTISPRSDSAATGSIAPPHSAARSPGLTSTWRDHRHRGQWLV